MKKIIYFLCFVAALFISPLAIAADYTIIDLGTLGGDYSSEWAINNSGQVAITTITNKTLPDGSSYADPDAVLYDNDIIPL